MKKNSLGFFSFNALIALVLTVLITGIFVVSSGSAMFSPGQLSNLTNGDVLNGVSSHADIGHDCSVCHAAPWEDGTMAERCLDCHLGIKVELAVEDSLHGVLHSYNPNFNCQNCHPEHEGDDALLTEMAPELFPHELLGFSLAAHQRTENDLPFKCADCHTERITLFEQDTCSQCHQKIDSNFIQTHTTAYGTDCLACHDGYETYNSDFDHAQTDFQLSGAHTETNCSACHQNAHKLDDFKNTAEECVTCHLQDDVHENRFGANCGVCHTPAGWMPTDYSHDRTAFSLEGKHRELGCEQCHKTGLAEETSTACYACHAQDDQHQGQFGKECDTCHTAQGWQPATFLHEETQSTCVTCHKIDDAHNGKFGTNCATCHSTDAWQPSIFDHERTKSKCITCHVDDDAHAQRFGTACEVCHATDAWIPTNFSHTRTAFPLEGKHRELGCEKCHTTGLTENLPTECYACHQQDDAHHGEFGKDCNLCHTSQAWKPASFDHVRASSNCSTCHLQDDNHQGKFGSSCGTCHSTNAWKPANFSHTQASSICSTCHLQDDNHQGKFGKNCGTCHSTNAWKPANFSHTQVSSTCSTCHLSDDNHKGKFGTNCASCHNTNAWNPANFSHSQVSNQCSTCHLQDDNHNGKFGTTCSACHNTNAWKPANFDHSKVSSNCSTCHVDNHKGKFGTTCSACHNTNT
jgi:hypothetical protein